MHQPRFSPRSPPCKFFWRLQFASAIDFAVLRMRSCGAWNGVPLLAGGVGGGLCWLVGLQIVGGIK